MQRELACMKQKNGRQGDYARFGNCEEFKEKKAFFFFMLLEDGHLFSKYKTTCKIFEVTKMPFTIFKMSKVSNNFFPQFTLGNLQNTKYVFMHKCHEMPL